MPYSMSFSHSSFLPPWRSGWTDAALHASLSPLASTTAFTHLHATTCTSYNIMPHLTREGLDTYGGQNSGTPPSMYASYIYISPYIHLLLLLSHSSHLFAFVCLSNFLPFSPFSSLLFSLFCISPCTHFGRAGNFLSLMGGGG